MKKICLIVIVFLLLVPALVYAFEKQVETGNEKIDDFSQKSYNLYYDLERIETKLRNANVMMIWILTDPEEFKIKLQGVALDGNDIDNLINEKIKNLPVEISISAADLSNLINLTYYDVLKKTVNGVEDGIVSLPDEMNSLKNQIQELISIAVLLPNEAKSLGFKAPKALKAIKANVEVLEATLKKIPDFLSEANNTIQIVASFLSQKPLTISLNSYLIELEELESENITVSDEGDILKTEKDIYSNQKNPEFSTQELFVKGSDFLNWYKQGDESHLNLNLEGNYTYFSQKTERNLSINENISLSYVDSTETSNVNNVAVLGYERYFNKFQVFTNDILQINYNNQTSSDSLYIQVGGGYGRIIDVTYTSKAYTLIKELEIEYSEDILLKISEIIGKREEYKQKYKDEADEKYFHDIAQVIGKPDAALSLQRILTNSIYQFNRKKIGWQVVTYYSNSFLTDEEYNGNLHLRGEYSKPLGLDKQFNAFAEYRTSLDEEAIPEILLGADFTLDHLATWSSFAGLNYNRSLPSSGDATSLFLLEAGTRKNILNKLVSEVSANISQESGDDARVEFKVNFIYYIF